MATERYMITAILQDQSETLPGSFGTEVSGVTVASGFPTVCTKAAHGLKEGDVVYADGFTQATYLNNDIFSVVGVTTNKFNLAGLDSTDKANESTGGRIKKAFIEVEREKDLDDETYIDLSWTQVNGARYYNIYKLFQGNYSFLAEVVGLNYRDDGSTEPNPLQNPPYKTDLSPTGFPTSSAYYQQRRIFDGGADKPNTWLASRVGDQYNYVYTGEVRDDSPMEITIASSDSDGIQHIVSGRDLLFLASDSEWVVSTGQRGFAPTSIQINPQTRVGSSATKPLLVNNQIIIEKKGVSGLYSLAYNYDPDSYVAQELTLFARHLFSTSYVQQMVYVSSPENAIICVMADGTINYMSYYPDQEVIAWTWFDTDGFFESVATVPNSATGHDDVYFVVQRQVSDSGTTYTTRGVETLDFRDYIRQADAFFVDSGLSYSGTPTSTLSGLDHLRGKEVVALADGGVVKGLTVSSTGSITLPTAASNIHVGLPYTTQIKTLNFENPRAETLQGAIKKIPAVTLRFYRSKGFKINVADADPVKQRERVGEEDTLITRDEFINLNPTWDTDASLTIEQEDPLPLSLLAIIPEMTAASRETSR